MFPLRVRGREVSAYQPSWDVAFDDQPYRDAHPRPVPRRGLAVGLRWPCSTTMGSRLQPPAHRRRHRPGPRRAPDPRPRRPALRRGAGAGGRARVRPGTSSSRSTPGARSTAPSGRPTWPRRSPSAACTSSTAATRSRDGRADRRALAPPVGPRTNLASMLRSAILAAARNERVEHLVSTAPISRDVVRRYVGGDDTAAASMARDAGRRRAAPSPSTISARTPPTAPRRRPSSTPTSNCSTRSSRPG